MNATIMIVTAIITVSIGGLFNYISRLKSENDGLHLEMQEALYFNWLLRDTIDLMRERSAKDRQTQFDLWKGVDRLKSQRNKARDQLAVTESMLTMVLDHVEEIDPSNPQPEKDSTCAENSSKSFSKTS